MPIIRDMIYSSKIRTEIGLLILDDDDPAAQHLLDQIGRNERRRFEKRDTIPVQVLQVFWNWGIPLSAMPPEIGISRERVCEALWKLSKTCPDPKTGAAALYLYDDTVRELMPRRPPRRLSKIRNRTGEKTMPRSELRLIPGTIF